MRRSMYHALLVTALAVTLAGCDNDDESLPTEPTPPTTVTTQLTGSLTVNGAETKTFNVGASGTVTATITALARQGDPPAGGETETLVVGLGLGTWNGSSCQVLLAKDDALQGSTVIGAVGGVGTLCVRMIDVGRLPAPVTYTVDVVHPQ